MTLALLKLPIKTNLLIAAPAAALAMGEAGRGNRNRFHGRLALRVGAKAWLGHGVELNLVDDKGPDKDLAGWKGRS